MSTQDQPTETILLSPKAELQHQGERLAARPATLKGATIAVINAFTDPERSNADLVARRTAEVIQQAGASQTIIVRKEASGRDLPEATLERIVAQAQGVVILEGD